MDKVVKDVVTSYMSILESEAGIMPRAIHHIFQGLQRLVYNAMPLNERKRLFLPLFLVCGLYRENHIS